MNTGRILAIILLSAVLVSLSSGYHNLDSDNADSPPETECTNNPERPACKGPNFADDQAEYFFDLDASWIFSGSSQPDDSGPSAFIGQIAGNLRNTDQDTEASTDTVEEQYIENTGAAETSNWGRGNPVSTLISIPNAKTIQGENGDRLVNPPHTGMCGDGQTQSGETTTNCPQDQGTPHVVELTDQPQPERTNQYDEPSGSESYHFGDGESPYDPHLSGSRSGAPDYHTSGTYIKKDTINEGQTSVLSGTHHWVISGPTAQDYAESSSTTEIKTGEDSTDSQTFCTATSPRSNSYNSVTFERTTDSASQSTESYNALDNYGTSTLTVEVSYNEDYSGDPTYGCDSTSEYNTECSCDPSLTGCDCKKEDRQTHGSTTVTPDVVQSQDWTVSRDTFSIQTSNLWGPVNDKPEMFSVDIVNTNYGYHSDISDLENNKQGSNDPSVSANKYELVEGSTYFEAHRTKSNVADADGPDGTGDGTIAFKQDTGVTGTDENIFTSETWNGNDTDYTGKSDVQLNSCPGDSIRCIASLDLKAKQTGWGSNSEDSYEIVID